MAKFPDLNKDGKVTQADILMGRGVKLDKGGRMVYLDTGETPVVAAKEQIGATGIGGTQGLKDQGARTFSTNEESMKKFKDDMIKEEKARLKEKGGEMD